MLLDTNIRRRTCDNCGKILSGYQKQYCSRSCAAKCNNTKRKVIKRCLNCGKVLPRKSMKYCSNACQSVYQSNKYIEEWKLGKHSGVRSFGQTSKYIKTYIKNKYGNACSKCGFQGVNPVTGLSILQINHIDGNYQNNSEGNLELLCPNCHAMTPTFGSLNMGNGRTLNPYIDVDNE